MSTIHPVGRGGDLVSNVIRGVRFIGSLMCGDIFNQCFLIKHVTF